MKKWITAMLAACLLVVPAGAADEPSDWAQEAVQTAREAELVPEELDGSYTAPITRAEFCALAAAVYHSWAEGNLLGEVEKNSVLFTDCTDGNVLLCASLGIVNGVGDGRFEPDNPIQRQEAASMLHRLGSLRADYDGSVQGRLPHVFSDGADISSWARDDVNWAYRHGVMTGTGDNAFEPAGEYTREQSIATMLRIYDAAYAVIPPAEQGAQYQVVVDETGAGVGRIHIEDADGNRLLTDFEGTDGYFYDISLFGDWASLRWQPDAESGFVCALYNLETGASLPDYYCDSQDAQTGTAWAYPLHEGAQNCHILYADGTYSEAVYQPVTGWADGKAIVRDGNAVRAIDRNGSTLWRMNISLDQVQVYSDLGDRLVIERDGVYSLIVDGKMAVTGRMPMQLNRWSDTYIGQDGGYYALYDLSGSRLTGTYPNAMDEVGQDIYAYWVSDTEYTYIRCTEYGNPETLFTVSVSQRPGALPTDGAGVYALQTGTREVTCFDRFGDTLGTIEAPFDLRSVAFENGCILAAGEDAEGAQQTARFLPTGEQVV